MKDWPPVEKFITFVLISYKKRKKDNKSVTSLGSKERSVFISLLVGRREMRQKTLMWSNLEYEVLTGTWMASNYEKFWKATSDKENNKKTS